MNLMCSSRLRGVLARLYYLLLHADLLWISCLLLLVYGSLNGDTCSDMLLGICHAGTP